MSTFAEWIERKELNDLADVQTLRNAARQLGDKWPPAKEDKAAHADTLEHNLPDTTKAPAKRALDAIWPFYQAQSETEAPLVPAGALRQMVANLPAAAVALAAGVILILFFNAFSHIEVSDLAKPEIARGLLTFLFGVTTVGIAIIVVLAVFLGNGAGTELGDRFQRGKDILTVLIGVFGAILGYYFGSDKGPTGNPPNQAQVQGQRVSGSANAGTGAAQQPPGAAPAAPAPTVPPDSR